MLHGNKTQKRISWNHFGSIKLKNIELYNTYTLWKKSCLNPLNWPLSFLEAIELFFVFFQIVSISKCLRPLLCHQWKPSGPWLKSESSRCFRTPTSRIYWHWISRSICSYVPWTATSMKQYWNHFRPLSYPTRTTTKTFFNWSVPYNHCQLYQSGEQRSNSSMRTSCRLSTGSLSIKTIRSNSPMTCREKSSRSWVNTQRRSRSQRMYLKSSTTKRRTGNSSN